jgi:hypothetical protein
MGFKKVSVVGKEMFSKLYRRRKVCEVHVFYSIPKEREEGLVEEDCDGKSEIHYFLYQTQVV